LRQYRQKAKNERIQLRKDMGSSLREERRTKRQTQEFESETNPPDFPSFFTQSEKVYNYDQEVERRGKILYEFQRKTILDKHPRGPTVKGKQWVEGGNWKDHSLYTKNRYYMTPEQYYDLVSTLFDPPSENSIASIRGAIQKNEPIWPPMITVELSTGQVVDHEGRHRSIAARMEGLKELPVYIFWRYKGYGVDVDDEVRSSLWHKPSVPYELKRQEEPYWSNEEWVMGDDYIGKNPAYSHKIPYHYSQTPMSEMPAGWQPKTSKK
jgi:hypothetical protein